MLGVRRLTASRADYYLSDLAQELPVSSAPHPGQGAWIGQAASGLGLRGPVDEERLRAVLEGRHPENGPQMRSGRATVLGFDLTFSAPKSASVLFALGGEDVARHILMAHAEAVGGALTYMEDHGVSATRRAGTWREVVPTTGVLAGSFTHGVSRNGDPHLHSHIVMANMVHGQDGRWSACDQRGISAHREAASAVYDAHLRSGMTARLGVRWTQAPLQRAEVSGVSPLLLGEFSSRSADIRRHLAEVGTHSSRANHIAWAVTRPTKQSGASYSELTSSWGRRARSLGVDQSELAMVLGQGIPDRQSFNEHQFAALLSMSPDGGARRRDVIAALGGAAADGAAAGALETLTDMWVPSPSHAQVGVAEDTHQRRTFVPGRHLLGTLGPRPVDPEEHRVWRQAALAIDGYRERWGVTRSMDAYGVGALSTDLAALPTNRLVDHLRTTQAVQQARAFMGRREPHVMELARGR
ncbi:MAG TPA: MobF family relaxase [Acidimicrobiales bacterium]|nr:MobF family relaxase [Acidimicrobiales bacterium]